MIGTSPGNPDAVPTDRRPTTGGHPSLPRWLLLGLLAYWAADAAIGLPVSMALIGAFVPSRGQLTLAVQIHTAVQILTWTLGYLTLRYWMIPPGPWTLRSAVLLPLLVLAGMAFVAALTTWLEAWINMELLLAAFRSDVMGGAPLPGEVFSLLVLTVAKLVAGALTGLGLWFVERSAARLLSGAVAPWPGPALCRAHTAGAVFLALALMLPSALFLLGGAGALSSLPVTAAIGARLGGLPHLWLTWRAWRGAGRAAERARRLPG